MIVVATVELDQNKENVMNKIGIYYAYWTHDWDADFVPYVEKVSQLGFDILEVNAGTVTNMSSSERQRLKNAAQKANIDLTYCIGLTKEYDVASDDASVRKNGIEFLKKSTEMLHEMGGKQLSGIIYGMWPGTLNEKYTSKEKALENSINSLEQITPILEDYDVYFNVEVVNRFEQFLMNTCEEGLQYLGKLGSPNVKMLLDTFHMNIEEDSIAGAIVKAEKKLGHLHIGENNRKPPGHGHIPWDELGAALKQIDFQGAVVMEPFLMPGGEVGRDIKVFRNIMSPGYDLDEEARKAVEFIRAKLK